MSLYVHIGQGGIQMCEPFWRLASLSSLEPVETLHSPLFHEQHDKKAHCILVDTEPKVVHSMIHRCRSDFQPAHWNISQSGRGNNWAMGYKIDSISSAKPARNLKPSKARSVANIRRIVKAHRSIHKASKPKLVENQELMEEIQESFQKEMETLDRYNGTILTLSMGGGTGSGVGSRVLESIRDMEPKHNILVTAIAPSCNVAQSPLQSYNSVLAFDKLHKFADAVVFKMNDDLVHSVKYWKRMRRLKLMAKPKCPSTFDNQIDHTNDDINQDVERVTLEEMNLNATTDLAGIVMPIYTIGRGKKYTMSPFNLPEFVQAACPIQSMKYLDIKTGLAASCPLPLGYYKKQSRKHDNLFYRYRMHHALPVETTTSCDSQTDDVSQMSALARATAKAFVEPKAKCAISKSIANIAFIRGFCTRHNASTFPQSCESELEKLSKRYFITANNTSNSTFATTSSDKKMWNHADAGSSITFCINNGHHLPSMSHYLDRARQQFHANAYLHWYYKYGMEKGEFEQAFNTTDQVVAEYTKVTR